MEPNPPPGIEELLEAEADRVPQTDSLVRCREAARMIQVQRLIVQTKEEELKAAQEELARLETQVLPEIMSEVGIPQFSLEDGSSIGVADEYYAHISKEHQALAHGWLRANNFGDLVKNQYTVSFGRGEDAKAQELEQTLKANGYEFENRESVHANTLKAFIKERYETAAQAASQSTSPETQATLPPADLFGIHIVKKAVITPPKKRRAKKQ